MMGLQRWKSFLSSWSTFLLLPVRPRAKWRPVYRALRQERGELARPLRVRHIQYRCAKFSVGSEEARVKRWPPSAAQTARTVFPYAAFTKTQRRQDAREGIK